MSPEARQFDGLVRLTVRVYRANLAPLTAVAALAVVFSLVAAFMRGSGDVWPLSGHLFGLSFYTGTQGSGIHVDPLLCAYGMASIVIAAWANATMIAMLLRHLRGGRRARLRDLAAGLPYLAWMAIGGLLVAIVEAGLSALVFFTLPESPWDVYALLALRFLLTVVVLFYPPLIIDGRDGVRSLYRSWRLVRDAGFWRVLAYLFGAYVLIMALGFLSQPLLLLLPGPTLAILVVHIVLGLLTTPLLTAYVVVMYLMATGARVPLLETATASADGDPDSRGPLARE